MARICLSALLVLFLDVSASSAAERADLVAFLESLTSPALKDLAARAAATEIGNPVDGAR